MPCLFFLACFAPAVPLFQARVAHLILSADFGLHFYSGRPGLEPRIRSRLVPSSRSWQGSHNKTWLQSLDTIVRYLAKMYSD